MTACHARRYSDQMSCGACGLVWDVSDPEPPACNRPEAPPSPLDVQVGGLHYKGLGIPSVEFVAKNGWDFVAGSALKCLSRYRIKNGVQDLETARDFVQLWLQLNCSIDVPKVSIPIPMSVYLKANDIDPADRPALNTLDALVRTPRGAKCQTPDSLADEREGYAALLISQIDILIEGAKRLLP